MKREPDRLGDALRELAAGLLEGAATSCRFSLESGSASAHFEVRLIDVVKKQRKRAHGLTRVGGVLVIYPNKRSAPGGKPAPDGRVSKEQSK